MAEHFRIVFEGQLRFGVEKEAAQASLAKLFNSDVAAIDRLFSGNRMTIKRGLTREDAQRYLTALNDAGVEAVIEPEQPVVLSLEEIEEPKPPMFAPLASPYAPPRTAVKNDWPVDTDFRVFTLEGRIGRLRFMAWNMALSAAAIVAFIVCMRMTKLSLVAAGLFGAIGVIAFLAISLIFSVRRLHDAGWSAWLLLVNLIPGVGGFFSLLLMVVPGNREANKFGPPAPPDTSGVRILSALWIVFLALIFVGALMGGAKKVKKEVQASTDEYEQSLPYDDDSAAKPGK